VLRLAIALSLAGPPAHAEALKLPTGREMYVGCYLFVQGKDVPSTNDDDLEPYSAASCFLTAGAAAEAEASKAGQSRFFCLPSTTAVNPYRDMALAYIEFYEASGSKMAELSSLGVMRAALLVKWPCRTPPK